MISAVSHAPAPVDVQVPSSQGAVATGTSSATLKPDTVSLGSQGQHAASIPGDRDHDGDAS